MLRMGRDLEHHLILDALAWDGWDVGMGRWGAQVGGAGPAILGQTPTCALSGCWGRFVEGLSTHGRGKGEGGRKGLEGRAMGRGRKKEDGGGWREKKVGCMNESQYLYTLHSINKGIILHGARAGSVLDQAGLKGRAA